VNDDQHQRIVARSYAKLNLGLKVGAVREDGYHAVNTVLQCIGLHDCIEFVAHPSSKMTVQCSHSGVPSGNQSQHNLVTAGLRAAGYRGGAAVRLQKNIPVGGGLGGGSSNGAAGLVVGHLWGESQGVGMCIRDLSGAAAELGTDVPFFLQGGTQRARGRGDVLSALRCRSGWWALVVWPGLALQTAAVYSAYSPENGGGTGEGPDIAAIETAIGRRDLSSLLHNLGNDLERPAVKLSPHLGEVLGIMRDCLGRPVQMSGSGACCFTLYASQGEAQMAQEKLRELDALWTSGQAGGTVFVTPFRCGPGVEIQVDRR